MGASLDSERTPQATPRESIVLLAQGVLKGWLLLAIGATAGYALALGVARSRGNPIGPIPFDRLLGQGPIEVVGMFGIAGWLIESLRVQGQPEAPIGLPRWSAARQLRAWLLTSLGVAAVGVGLYAGLWW